MSSITLYLNPNPTPFPNKLPKIWDSSPKDEMTPPHPRTSRATRLFLDLPTTHPPIYASNNFLPRRFYFLTEPLPPSGKVCPIFLPQNFPSPVHWPPLALSLCSNSKDASSIFCICHFIRNCFVPSFKPLPRHFKRAI